MNDEPLKPNNFEDLNWDAIEQRPLFLRPAEPVAFNANLFQWLLDEQARIHALYGPSLIRISGCEPLVCWLMHQFPEADPRVMAVTVVGIALRIDDEVPLDSLRLTYADGTHKDVRVIEPYEPPTGYEWKSGGILAKPKYVGES